MPLTLNEIRKPIEKEIEVFEEKFKESMRSSTPLLDRITHYIVKRKGKQIRPMFVFFAANVCGGINESTYRGAALVELLHTASLVHDDVVDDAYERRGMFSINALWKNKIAVLVGDFLLAKGLLLSVENNDHKLLQIVSDAVKQMSEGELLQIEKVRKLDIDEQVYYDVIRQKTASLIASCCACGAASAGLDEVKIQKMKLFGEHVGMAFQIKDDLLDFSDSNTGKQKGIDIKEKKITLPLIYAMKNADRKTKSYISGLIKNYSDNTEKVVEVIEFVKKNGGIEYATTKMLEFQDKAFNLLEDFENSPSKTALRQLVLFTTDRKY